MRREIAALFDHDGPFVSIYLDARSDQPQAEQILETRWKTARSGLSNEGATDEDLAAVDQAVAPSGERRASHVGGDTLAVIAAGGKVLLRRHLPAPPAADAWRIGLLPWVGPLIQADQTLVAHVAVYLERTGAEIHAFDSSGHPVDETLRASINEDVEVVKAGGWSQRRNERRAVETWKSNAGEVADEVVNVAKQVDARVIAVTGEADAVRLVCAALPKDTAALVRHLDEHGVGTLPRLLDTFVAEETVALLERQRDAEGVGRTVEALERGAVATLLVHDDPADTRMAWFGREPLQLATDRAALEAMGVEHPQQGRLIDACIRAALGSSADVRIVPAAVLTDGLAAILRY